MPTPSREIELFGVKVEVPEHERFRIFKEGVWFDGDSLDSMLEAICDRRAKLNFESACCIAIVWWQDESETRPRASLTSNPRTDANAATKQAHNWRLVLAASRQRRNEKETGE